MNLKLALSATVASLLFATPVFASPDNAPSGHHAHGNREERMMRKYERMERRLDRAVEHGRLTRQQADEFLAEARQLRDDVRARFQANGGQLNEEQKQQFQQRRQALREKVHAALKATQPAR